jgi:hypothetical protein
MELESVIAWILKSIEPLTLTVIILKVFFDFFWICQHDYIPIFQGAGRRGLRLLEISVVLSRLFSLGYLICWAILINISSALWLFGFSWLGSNCLNLIKFLPGPGKFGLPRINYILAAISVFGFIFLPILGFLLIKQF